MPGKLNLDLNESSVQVAQRLLGCLLIRQTGDYKLIGKIVETEAYDQSDAASHSFNGETPRTSVMFGPAGFSYVYFTYGMHYCFNVVTGQVGQGSAVLIRALEPLEGLDIMAENRKYLQKRPSTKAVLNTEEFNIDNIALVKNLCSGPAKLCQALMIDTKLNAHDLSNKPLELIAQEPVDAKKIVQTTRIGITRDKYRLWRFYLINNKYVSRK